MTIHRADTPSPVQSTTMLPLTAGGKNSSQDDGQIEQVAMRTVFAWITLVLCLTGLSANFLSMIVFRMPHMRTSANTMLLGLCFVDALLLTLAIPLFVVVDVSTPGNLYSYIVYAFLYPISMIARSSSVWLFIVITAERYLAVCKPFLARRVATTTNARRALLFVFAIAIIYNLPRFWEITYEDDGDSGIRAVLGIRKEVLYRKIYHTSLFLATHFLLPFSLLVVVNSYIVVTIRLSQRQRSNLSSQQAREHKTTHMMAALVVLFICTNSLPYVLNAIEATLGDSFFQDPRTANVADALSMTSNVLVVLNSATSPLIYWTFSSRYRKTAVAVVRCRGNFQKHRFESVNSARSCQTRTLTTRSNPCHYVSNTNSLLCPDDSLKLQRSKSVTPTAAKEAEETNGLRVEVVVTLHGNKTPDKKLLRKDIV